jgi:hypothetical protein
VGGEEAGTRGRQQHCVSRLGEVASHFHSRLQLVHPVQALTMTGQRKLSG